MTNGDDKTSLGLTKREYFAGMAMQGIIAGLEYWESDACGDVLDVGAESVRMADVLIRALNGANGRAKIQEFIKNAKADERNSTEI